MDQILEASLENTNEELAAQVCTTLGDGDDRYVFPRASHTCDSRTLTVKVRTLPQSVRTCYATPSHIQHACQASFYKEKRDLLRP